MPKLTASRSRFTVCGETASQDIFCGLLNFPLIVFLVYNILMYKLRVGVIRGGPSREYEVSLDSGASVLSSLREHFEQDYQSRDVFIDRQGNWHIDGIPISPNDISTKADVVFNALHGTYGEDGKVQAFFESHGIPFTGSGSLGSAVGMNKILSKKVLNNSRATASTFTRTESD